MTDEQPVFEEMLQEAVLIRLKETCRNPKSECITSCMLVIDPPSVEQQANAFPLPEELEFPNDPQTVTTVRFFGTVKTESGYEVEAEGVCQSFTIPDAREKFWGRLMVTWSCQAWPKECATFEAEQHFGASDSYEPALRRVNVA